MNKLFPKRSGLWFSLASMMLVGALSLMPAMRPVQAQVPAAASVTDLAERIRHLVEDRRLEELSSLSLPAGDDTSKLATWKADYVNEMRKSEALRAQHYNKATEEAKDLLGRQRLGNAVDSAVDAYLVASDRDAFLNLDWVKDLTAKASAHAAGLEKQGNWLESLQLYTNLNSLYEIDTRFKPDVQRLARRVRLLALYTPKTLADMRKTMLERMEKEKAKEGAATAPAAPTAEEKDPLMFPRWQDHVEKIDLRMARRAIDEARRSWVEPTNYETLLRGGVESLRLFLTTPELAQEFPNLAKQNAKTEFASALNNALAQINPDKRMDADTMHQILDDLLAANARTISLPTEVALMEFTDGAMEKLDPFTAVIWPHELAEFEKSTRGTFGGVGIQIQMETNGQLKVISPLEDTPAYNAGIQADDIITAIDGKTTIGMSIDQAVRQITGEPDTQVTLSIKREGVSRPLDFPLTRAQIRVSSIKGFQRDPSDPAKWRFMIDNENKIGYIRITGFQEDTAAELKNAIQTLQNQGCRGLVLDLRFNPGGLLKAAIEMSGMFINTERPPYPTIVSTKGNTTTYWRAPARGTPFVPPSLPVVVLVNQYSASASEIFSGAIKDLHRGLIVGQRSFGKGSVQDVIPLEEKDGMAMAAIKLTKSYYYLPDGESLHRRDGEKKWGVEPDVTVELTPAQIRALVEARRNADIISRTGATAPAPAGAASTQKAADTQKSPPEPLLDTQLDTALLMLRLQLVQPRA